jgi:hypothetical protein
MGRGPAHVPSDGSRRPTPEGTRRSRRVPSGRGSDRLHNLSTDDGGLGGGDGYSG